MSTPFMYDNARKWVNGWVGNVGDPQLSWAWNATVGVIDLYASISLTPTEGMHEKRAEFWMDWFVAWEEDGGEAHYGIYGVMQEFMHACPDGMESEQLLVISEAFGYGKGESAPRGRRKPVPSKEVPKPPTKASPFQVLKGGKP